MVYSGFQKICLVTLCARHAPLLGDTVFRRWPGKECFLARLCHRGEGCLSETQVRHAVKDTSMLP